MFGFGLTDATFFAAMTRGSTQTVNRTSLLTLEGQPATLHLGDRYPVITNSSLARERGRAFRKMRSGLRPRSNLRTWE